jgi:NADH-quinone oxidoreductase subunit L
MRLWRLTFFGAPRTQPAEHGHEPPWTMRAPVLVLAAASVVVGFVGLWTAFGRRLGADGAVFHLSAQVVVPLILAATGVALAWRRDPAADPILAVRPRRALANAFYLDAVQDALVVRPARALAAMTRRADESIVDGAVESAGASAFGAGGLLARAHRAGLPRAATAALTGAVLIGAVAAKISGTTTWAEKWNTAPSAPSRRPNAVSSPTKPSTAEAAARISTGARIVHGGSWPWAAGTLRAVPKNVSRHNRIA